MFPGSLSCSGGESLGTSLGVMPPVLLQGFSWAAIDHIPTLKVYVCVLHVYVYVHTHELRVGGSRALYAYLCVCVCVLHVCVHLMCICM